MHGKRAAYYIVNQGFVTEPELLSGGRAGPAAGAAGAPPSFRFGRMFQIPERCMKASEWFELYDELVKLGLHMNDPAAYSKRPPGAPPPDSNIPSGYTYLGQFIAHEITFDNSTVTPTPHPENRRSPSIDLDSLYGDGPGGKLYKKDDPVCLRVGPTDPGDSGKPRHRDLPRRETGVALVGDLRNDQNLAVAQTTVALIRFHNKVVETLRKERQDGPDLFERARAEVVRHFQWIVLHDFLPKLVDGRVLDDLHQHGPRWFRVKSKDDLYMPLEFSAAAFRIGHSMVRSEYQWNWFHERGSHSEMGARLEDLFQQTALSGILKGNSGRKRLLNQWVIDWTRFFEFPKFPTPPQYAPPPTGVNMAKRIDTVFDLHLDRQVSFDHGSLPPERRSITVRNLLRGFALGLPTGEEVAKCIGAPPLEPQDRRHKELLSAPIFKGRTPLWYYILKEAELNVEGDGRLGPVGSRIVAETLYVLINHSPRSILAPTKWYPKYTRRGEAGTPSARFEMVDLLDFAGVVSLFGD